MVIIYDGKGDAKRHRKGKQKKRTEAKKLRK